MKLEVTVSEVTLETIVSSYTDATLADAIAEQAAKRLVQDDSYTSLADRIARIRDEEIRALVTPMIREAFDNPIRMTNSFGEDVGKTVTLREVIVNEGRKILGADSGYSGSYNDRESLARKLIREELGQAFKNELAAALKTEKDKVVAAVRAQAAELIAEAVTKGVNGR